MSPGPSAPIGVFDSGVGGLSVLDRLMVALPDDDLVYFGDTAFFPYGVRAAHELRRRALAIARWLEAQGAKLIVVACNTASAVALPDLQRRLATPVIGLIRGEVHAAVATTRNRRIGLLATPATVASGAYERLVRAHDAGAALTSVPCPDLAPLVQEDGAGDPRTAAVVGRCTAPLRAVGVDTVVLGCTHYALVDRALRRALPGVTLIESGVQIAADVAAALDRRGLRRPPGRNAGARFACSGDPARFRELGGRYLQMPLGEIESADPEADAAA